MPKLPATLPVAPTSSASREAPTAARERLIAIADEFLEREGIDAVSIDTIAAAAGVSRATAFRQLGGRDQMVVAVALARSRRFSTECVAEMSRRSGAFAKLEAAFVYLARELPRDPIMRELFALTPSGEFGPEGNAIAEAALGPTIEAGRAAGEVRGDIATAEIIRWVVEQMYLAVSHADRSEAAVVRRVRTFISPALSTAVDHAPPGVVRSQINTMNAALSQAQDALTALRDALPDVT